MPLLIVYYIIEKERGCEVPAERKNIFNFFKLLKCLYDFRQVVCK